MQVRLFSTRIESKLIEDSFFKFYFGIILKNQEGGVVLAICFNRYRAIL
jgi:hypothetical protein